MLEIADREFQAIQDANSALEFIAQASVEKGILDGVEITPNSIKLFLDKALGADGRISDWTYDWLVRLLHQLGFRDLKQVETAIKSYDDIMLSGLAKSRRAGQIARFELMLLAAMGKRFVERHIYNDEFWFQESQSALLESFVEAGIPVGIYDPISITTGWAEKLSAAQDVRMYEFVTGDLVRIRYGDETPAEDLNFAEFPCGDCAAVKGQYHVPGCAVERCPSCRGQYLSCECARKTQALR
jgi:hypothetical protein